MCDGQPYFFLDAHEVQTITVKNNTESKVAILDLFIFFLLSI
jgi:hypothetical protein